MTLCKSCGAEVSAKLVICPICGKNPRQAPPSAAPEQNVSAAPAPAREPIEDHPAPPKDELALESSPPARVTLTLPDHTRVEIEVDQRLILGRQSPNQQVARAFAGFEDVSRSHVRFVNDEHGPALVMLGDTGGQYGTFLDDRRLPNNTGDRVPLRDGDRIRLGEQQAWVSVKVHRS